MPNRFEDQSWYRVEESDWSPRDCSNGAR